MITKPIKKRDFLWNEKTSQKALLQEAEQYFENEQWSDALDFFERAEHAEGLERIKQVAIETAQGFLLNRLSRYNPDFVSKSDWEKLRETASSKGYDAYVVMADRRINPELAVEDEDLGLGGIEEVHDI